MGVVIYILAIVPLFGRDLTMYIALAGPLLVFSGLLAGLSFAFCSVVETQEDRQTILNAGEKFFYATLCLGFSVLAAWGTVQVQGPKYDLFHPWLKELALWILLWFALVFLACAGGALIHSHDWLVGVFLTRWERRLRATDSEVYTPPEPTKVEEDPARHDPEMTVPADGKHAPSDSSAGRVTDS